MFTLQNKNNIEYLTSDLINDETLSYGFLTRNFGVSKNNMASLSVSAKDFPELEEEAKENRKLVCETFRVEYQSLIMPDQQHTNNIAIIKEGKNPPDLKNTDGVITNIKNLPIMLVFADCVPIILYDEITKTLGVIHAGWRGTASTIAKEAVSIFKNKFNSNPKDIKALIGPAISKCCFTLPDEIAKLLNMTIKTNYDNIFSYNRDKNVNVDLKELNKTQLIESGVLNVDVCKNCTSCETNLFFSYRKEQGKTGRQGAIAALKG